MAGLHKQIRQQLSRKQDFKNGLTRAAWESDLMTHVLSGLHVRCSGTTAVACAMTGRRCIVIEQNEEYCEIAARWIENAIREKNTSKAA